MYVNNSEIAKLFEVRLFFSPPIIIFTTSYPPDKSDTMTTTATAEVVIARQDAMANRAAAGREHLVYW